MTAGLDVVRAALAGQLDVEETDDGLRPWRLPPASRRHAPESLALMAEFASGVRLRLRTDADRLEIDASVFRLAMRHLGRPTAPARWVAVVDGLEVVADLEETGVVVETADRRFERGPAVRSTVVLDLGVADGERDVVVWLPQDASVELHSIRAFRRDSPASATAMSPQDAVRWLHHGSSISHGGTASGPTRTWPVLAASALGVSPTNLGFGGNAMLDPMTARAIAGARADVITLKLGINVVGADAMRRRTFVPALHGFLDLVREGHPGTPIVVLSAIGCPALERAPGPIAAGVDGRIAAVPRPVLPGDGSLTLELSRELIQDAVADRAADDPALSYVDGRTLLAPDEDALLPDGLHPADEGYALMARRFAALAADPSHPLGAAFGPERA